MHLLLAQKGALADEGEAIDLGQDPAEVLFLTAADTELACFSAAHDPATLSLRLANTMALSHPMSVDVYCENTVAASKLVIVRVLGGKPYWTYGLERLQETCLAHGTALLVLPGDDKPDPSLEGLSTLDAETRLAVWACFVEGGVLNARAVLAWAADFVKGGSADLPVATPLLKAGFWWPGSAAPSVASVRSTWPSQDKVVAICFYRALVQAGSLSVVEALIEGLTAHGLGVVPVFVSSLKDPVSQETVRSLFADARPNVVINLTGFAVSSTDGARVPTVLEEGGAVVLQGVLASGSREDWSASDQGLTARDLAMNVALPEVDGRVLSRAIAFKNAGSHDTHTQANLVRHEPDPDRVAWLAALAARWVRLAHTAQADKRIGIVLANYPNRDGRLGNGVGLDTPAGTVNVLNAMADRGYHVAHIPETGDRLIDLLQDGPTNAATDGRLVRETYSLSDYRDFFGALPVQIQNQVVERWGEASADPFFLADRGAFAISTMRFGNVVVGIQPARGYNIDPTDTYHSPDLVPPHGYLAFYGWLRTQFDADAVIHMGKHGNLEWLPGKALALSKTCFPEAVLGPLPHIYPFIVNDPGEGSQAKRRNAAVIIDHLTPPLTRAETYGSLKELEALVDEFYEASGIDPRRLDYLRKQIFELMRDTGLDQDAGLEDRAEDDDALQQVDAFLCELKEMQIRDGLHVFGTSPEGRLRRDLAVALARVPRALGDGADGSLQRSLAKDLLDEAGFDPLDCDFGQPWQGARPDVLQRLDGAPWRSNGDTVERLELLAAALVDGAQEPSADWQHTTTVMEGIQNTILPAIDVCGDAEIAATLAALDGTFVPPGPSGAPTRGRMDVLPTGRNFYSVDTRAVPTPAAWYLGQASAELLIKRYRQDHGEWPTSFGLSAWGTSNMRTGGDDIAQALALIGARPVWDHGSRRVTGFEVVTLAELGRPRVDVTLRISGFFRDAFPAQIDLFDKAVRAIGALDEDTEDNPIAHRMKAERSTLVAEGATPQEADRRAGFRVYGSKPGAYGAGLQALIDEKGWDRREDLAEAYLVWGSYAYGEKEAGLADRTGFEQRLAGVEAVVHNQDNREHDLLDSDDYYQFEGGMTATVDALSGQRPAVYHNDHSRPERPVVRSLDEEIARVVRARVVNPKWIAGVMRHGYKGAFEMAATVDYMFAFSATTGAVKDHHFDAVYQTYLIDNAVRGFLEDHNPHALKEIADRLLEALDRGLWQARSNSAKAMLDALAQSTPREEMKNHG
ncbi:MAG: cobaltochelatase subunit CobN [Pseudomonadota bacterium]